MASNPLSTLGTIFVDNENQGTTIVVSDHKIISFLILSVLVVKYFQISLTIFKLQKNVAQNDYIKDRSETTLFSS